MVQALILSQLKQLKEVLSYTHISVSVCIHRIMEVIFYAMFTVPSAPVITAVTAVDSQSVLVTWQAPAEPNGIITGYAITYSAGGSFTTINATFNGEMVGILIYLKSHTNTCTKTQSLNITGLSTYQVVAVTVTAINRAGRSSPGDQVSSRTMELGS